MTDTTMLFTFDSLDPEDISWQLSLGKTALDKVGDPEYAGLTAVEACLVRIYRTHSLDSGVPTPSEEKSLRLLVEDALGDASFQQEILPRLVKIAIEADNSATIAILIPYAEDQGRVLRLANAESEAKETPDSAADTASEDPDTKGEAAKADCEAQEQEAEEAGKPQPSSEKTPEQG